MTSQVPEQKEEIKCMNCELYKKELQEKEAKIKILENNLLKIKSLLSESGSLIDGYNEIMEENKNLKLEIERLKNNINKNSNDNYQFDLLKGKMLRFQEENEKLRSSIQFYESQKNQNINSKNSNEIKIKRELSLKDKEINQLNTVISILKLKYNEKNITNDEILKNFNKGNYDDNIIDKEEINFMGTNSEFNNDNEYRYNINNNNYNYKIDNNVKMIDLFKEKEYLGNEYNKYKTKYFIYKFKYHEFKKTTKLFLNTMKIIPPGNNTLDIIQSLIEKKSVNLLGNKRMKEKEEINSLNNLNAIRNININNTQERKISEDNLKIFNLPSAFNESYNNFDHLFNEEKNENINIKENDVEEKGESKTNNRKSRKKVIKNKKELNKEEKKESESDSEYKQKKKSNNNNDNKVKTESKKRGRKPKKESTKKENIKNEKEKEEKEEKKEKNDNNGKNIKVDIIKNEKDIKNEENKENKEIKKEKKNENPKEMEIEDENEKDNNKEINKEKGSKIIKEYIEPIPKNIKKKLDPVVQKALNTSNLLNLLSNNPDKITEENINSILSLQESLHEKISFLFEVIISNLIQLELSRVLTLFEVFIDITKEDNRKLIGINILENINLHLNTNSLLNKKIHLKVVNKSNETYKTYITKNFSSPIFLVSFLIDIIYRKLEDISCLSNFIYKLVFDKNIDEKNKTKMLIILTNTMKENIQDNNIKKLYYKEEQYNKYISVENENKVFFFLYYKNNLVTERIFNFILSIYPRESNFDSNIDPEIVNKFADIFNSIPDNQELKIEIPNFPEEYKSSIKFNSNLFYLEIFQALCIIVEIKDIKWIAENIFTNVLWKNFQNSKKDSLKRALSIYYTSLLFYLCLKAGIKNHGSENLLEQLEFSRIYGWLYSIYNPQIQFENFIGFYERICAMSWIIESPIMTMSTKVGESIKEVVGNIINGEKESLCPTDFMEKIKKLKLIGK